MGLVDTGELQSLRQLVEQWCAEGPGADVGGTAGGELELEVKFTDVDEPAFARLASYLKAHYGLTSGDRCDSLDIIVPRRGNQRTTVVGAADIQHYCARGCLVGPPHTCCSKQRVRVVKVPALAVTVTLSRECAVQVGVGEDAQRHWEQLRTEQKLFRFKSRHTCHADGGLFRLDLTMVKHSVQLSSCVDTRSVAHLRREFEIECVRGPRDPPLKPGDVLQSLMRLVTEFVQVVQGTDGQVLLTRDMRDRVLDGYRRLASQAHHIGGGPLRLLGPQATTMQLSHLYDDELNPLCVLRGYTVTDKLDGVRALLYVHECGAVYLLRGHRGGVELLPTGARCPRFPSTILDAELMADERVMAFDAYVVRGASVAHLPLVLPGAAAESGAMRLGLLRDVVGAIEGGVAGRHSFAVKNFYVGDGPEMFEHCRRILADTRLPIDGLVFTPCHLPVGAVRLGDRPKLTGSWARLIKWKPPVCNTIDFLVHGWVLHVGSESAQHRAAPLSPSVYEQLRLARGQRRPQAQGYSSVPFDPLGDGDPGLTTLAPGQCFGDGSPVDDGTVVECSWDAAAHRWVPQRPRPDKSQGNDVGIALDVWRSIHSPVTEAHVVGATRVLQAPPDVASRYYVRSGPRDTVATRRMADFHNWIKGHVLLGRFRAAGRGLRLLDVGCGKGGDLHKWRDHGFSTVLGLDVCQDNLTDPHNGAYSRLLDLDLRADERIVFLALDAARPLGPGPIAEMSAAAERDGESAAVQRDNLQMARCVWGLPSSLDAHVHARYSGLACTGFDVVSCQFAIHYFFASAEQLDCFCANVASHLKPGGFLVGTCFDGHAVDALFRQAGSDRIVRRSREGAVVWMLQKQYASFDGQPGCAITVYVDSISKPAAEWLVDYKSLVCAMARHGMVPPSPAQCAQLGLAHPTGMFGALWDETVAAGVSTTAPSAHVLGSIRHMTPEEKEFSFLNRWFIFTKAKTRKAARGRSGKA